MRGRQGDLARHAGPQRSAHAGGRGGDGMNTKRMPPGATGGGQSSGGAASSTRYCTTNARACKAPLASIPARLGDGGLILIGSQHVARVVGNELQRTLDLGRETLNGSILFRCDVLALARSLGARVAVCKDRNTGDTYRAALDAFNLKGWVYNHAKYGLQSGLSLAHWQRRAAGEIDAWQPGLWGP